MGISKPIPFLALYLITFAGTGCVTGVKVIGPETVAEIRAQEVDSAARLSLEGRAYYEADPDKKSGPQYCASALRFAYKGEFRRAIREATKALFLGELNRDDYVLGLAKRDIALTYNLAGKPKRAEAFINQAIDHLSRVHRTSSKGEAYLQRARAYAYKVRGEIQMRQGRPDEAIGDFVLALNQRQTLSPSLTDRIKAALGKAYLAKGDTAAAKRQFEELRDKVNIEILPLIERGLADVALREKRYADAVKLFERAAAEFKSSDDTYHYIWALDGLARAHAGTGDAAGAMDAYLKAIDSAEKVRGIFLSEELRAGFFEDIQSVFDRAIALLMQNGRIEAAFQASERGRARAFLDMIRDRVVSVSGSQAFAGEFGRVYSLAAIKKLLPDRTAVVEFHVLPQRVYAWIVRAGGIQAKSIEIDQEELSDLVWSYWSSTASRLPASSKSGYRLHQALVEPLNLGKGEKVIIVSHGVLHYLPFHALRGDDGYMIEARTISYAPSASALANLAERAETGRDRIIAFGNPDLGLPVFDLPNAEKEVRRIKALYPNTEIYVRKAATKQQLIDLAPGKNVVHVAAHAEIDQLDPLHSTIHMARTETDSGDLKAYEVYSVDLKGTKLVTLSACESGFGNVSRGDEIWGFTRTFLSAGAKSVLVSLWPVEDRSTEALMARFYDNWRRDPTADSLRSAQLALLHDEKTRHPFYWAPFILVGDWR